MALSQKVRKSKRIASRMCVSCKETQLKRGLIRIVRTPLSVVEIDLKGKKSGRGAYLCSRPECWEEAIKRKRIDHALKIEVSPEDKVRLIEFARTLQSGASSTSGVER